MSPLSVLMEMNMFIVALLLSIIPISAVRQTIFHDPITTSSLDTWTKEGTVTLTSSAYCPWSTECFILQSSGDIWNWASTIGFHTIQIHYALRSTGVSTKLCEFWYVDFFTNDANDAGWKRIDAASAEANDAPIHQTVSIDEAADQNIVGFSFYLQNGASGTCYLSNVTMSGIPFTKAPTQSTAVPSLPTADPTSTPTVEPSLVPTMEPTTASLATPTFTPSIALSSSSPTKLPSGGPTYAPSAFPSVAPTIFINSLCKLSSDYLKIWIGFNSLHIVKWSANIFESNATRTRCENIFINNTLLGDSYCIFSANAITVELASNAVIDLHDTLRIPPQMFLFIYNNETRSNAEITLRVLPPDDSIVPIIVATIPSIIGVCDDLILNAVNSTYLGGRDAIFKWEISSSVVFYDPMILVAASNVEVNSTTGIRLRLTTWYNVTVAKTFTVYKSKEPLPSVALSGPNTYSVANNNYNRDYIHIDALISYAEDCVTDTEDLSFPYSLFWSVSYANVLIEDYLQQQNELQNVDHIAVDTSLLSPGNKYIFTVTAQCNDDTVCKAYNVSDSLEIVYEFSDIVCSMYSTNKIYLNTLNAAQLLNDYILYLDGYTMTYDPDALSTKSHLKWQWKCADNANASCDYLFTSSASTASSKLITFQSDAITAYYFTMIVYDDTNENRSHCVHTLEVNIDLLDGASSMKYISVLLQTAASVIRPSDRLRLMVIVLNDEIIDSRNTYYQYDWRETNDSITSSDLIELNMNSGTNGNLILKENSLQKGKTYQFQVTVTKVSRGVIIGHGVSSSIDVHILDGPLISDVIMSPSCGNVTYLSFIDSLSTFYHISVIAEAEYRPLSYEFVYSYEGQQDSYNLHRSLLSEPHILNVLLPVGNFSIKSIVYDAKSSATEQEIQCHVSIAHAYNDSDECISFKDDVLHHINYVSNYQQLLHLLKSTEIYLNYMEPYDVDIDCLQLVLPEIIDVYHQFLTQNNRTYNFCQVDWTLFMAKIFTKYVTLCMELDIFLSHTQLHHIRSWLTMIVDPCSALTDIVLDIDLLFVSPQSIINGHVIIYYETQENDITHLINKAILSDSRNAYVLYEWSASLIRFVNNFNPTDANIIRDLLSKALYIHTLFQISSSIPGESTFNNEYDEFTLYFSRIDTNGKVNSTVDHIQVTIPTAVFSKGRDSFCDITQHVINGNDATKCNYNSVDVIIVSQNNTKTNVSVAADSEQCSVANASSNATLSDSAISIVLIGGNTSAGNVSITFNHEYVTNHSAIECVWYDEVEDIWKDTGCNTMIHYESRSVECDCNHLTTFSLVHNINFDECNELLQTISHSIAWRNAHVVFVVLFTFILCYTLRELLPFILHKHYNPIKEKALLSMSFIGIISLIHIIVCIIFIFIGSGSDWHQSGPSLSVKALLTFLIMCPQWIYFVIFSIVLYSWIIVSYRSTSTSTDKGANVGKTLVISTIFFIVYGLCDFIFISFVQLPSVGDIHSFYSLSQIVWIVFTLLATIIFAIFGCWTQSIVRKTAAVLETSSIASAEIRLANKLLVVTIVIILFFLMQCILLVYFLIFSEFNHSHMLQWRIFDLSSNVICLCFVAALYKNTLNRLRAEYSIKPMCYRAIRYLKRCKRKYMKRYRKRRRTTQPSKPEHVPADSATMTARKAHIAQEGTSTDTMTDTLGDVTPFSPPSADREVELGIYRISNTINLPALHELNEETSTNNKNKRRSTKKLKDSPIPEVIFERKELLKETKAKLARKCRDFSLPVNGTKGDLVNRLVLYQKKQFIEANEQSLTAESQLV